MQRMDVYCPGTSQIHAFDPRLKTGGWILLSLLLTFSGWQGLLISSLGLIGITVAGRIPLRAYRSLALALFLLGIFYTIALGWTWMPPQHIWQGNWSLVGLKAAALMLWRIALLFGLMRFFAAVTPILEQGLSLAYFLTPLIRLSPKVGELALLITLTLRFIPLLAEEAQMLWKARTIRGRLPKSKLGWVRELGRLLPPLIYLSLRRAEETAENLLTRGYTAGCYRPLAMTAWKKSDTWGTLVVAIWLSLLIIIDLSF